MNKFFTTLFVVLSRLSSRHSGKFMHVRSIFITVSLLMSCEFAQGQVTLTATSGSVSGSFTTLKGAFDAINAGMHQGAIVINITGNTTETASAVLNANDSGSARYTSVVITPSGGQSRAIIGAITGHLIDLNGADNVTIDGLNSDGNSLSISNTATGASSTLRFINDASNNTVQNTTIQGSTTSFGVVFFSTGTTTGNDGNNINNCRINNPTSNLPLMGIYSLGTSAAIDNSGNTINANSISDFFSAGSATFGINIHLFNSSWTISNNRFFQTATRTYTDVGNTHTVIMVASGNGYTITGNTIGYSSAGGTGVYTMSGNVTTRFVGIHLAVGVTTASSVQGNTITAITLATAATSTGVTGVLCGINISSGSVNVGNLTGNTIGSSSVANAIRVIPTASAAGNAGGAAVVGINSSSSGAIVIQNNVLGGLTSSGTTAAVSGNVFGINISTPGGATSLNISNNTIGNSTANNMRGGTFDLTTGNSLVAGINITSPPLTAIINNNTIRNLSSYGTSSSGYVRGITTTTITSANATGWTINNNTISNLITSSSLGGTTSGSISAVGIYHASSLGCTISQNTISNISNINSSSPGSIVVAGISSASTYNQTTTLVTSITRNTIFGLSNQGTGTIASAPPVIAGILVRTGSNINSIANNMISLGNEQSTNTTIIGIWSNNGSVPNPTSTNIYHNTVNIEGTVTNASGALSTFCFNRGDLTNNARTATVDLRNNIFNNTRSGGTGQHFAISNNFGASSTNTGWGVNASNYNVLNAAAGTIGYWNSALDFSGWKAASASDENSISGVSVPFTNTATADLHVNYGTTPTQLESGGTTLAAITSDFDNNARPGPSGSVNGGALFSDIGADEFDGVIDSLTWNGSVSTDWSNASNWTPAIVPDNRSKVILPSGLSNYPVLTTNVSINEVTLSSSTSLNLSSFNLTLSGNLTNNGSIAGTGILELNGAKAQQISGTGTVNNIKINNTSGGVSIVSGANTLYVTGLYTPTSGVLTTNGNLVFRSTATQEGVVGTAGTCPTEPISGDVTVEKYISAKRAFRFITPGVTTSTTINANWQEGRSVNSTAGYPYAGGTTENPTSGFGTHIMGAGGSANGFDLSNSNSPTLFTFNVSSYAWVAEANTNVVGNVLQRGEAYRLFVRGDRGANLNSDLEAATATTIRTTGVLKVCESMSFTTTSPVVPLSGVAGRYSFIGNPYWSVVDWHAVTKTNVEENLYYWDPTISGTNGRGGYVTYNQATLSNNTAGSLADRYIQPGQAFFVRNNPNVDGSILPAVTFDATDIVGSAPPRTAIFSRNGITAGEESGLISQERMQPATTTAIEKIYVSLFLKNKPGAGPADGFLLAYNPGFTDTYGKEDAAKFSNLDENITAVYNGSRQSILGLKAAIGNEVKSDTIPISITNLYNTEYVIKVTIDKSFNPAREVYLLNRITGQQLKVDHTNGLELSFLNALGVKAKEDLVLVVNSRSAEPKLPEIKKLVVYPNPITGGVVSLRVPLEEQNPGQKNRAVKIEIRNTNKRLVFKQQVELDNQGRATLNIGTMSGGVYVVKVSMGDKSFTAKMIKL